MNRVFQTRTIGVHDFLPLILHYDRTPFLTSKAPFKFSYTLSHYHTCMSVLQGHQDVIIPYLGPYAMLHAEPLAAAGHPLTATLFDCRDGNFDCHDPTCLPTFTLTPPSTATFGLPLRTPTSVYKSRLLQVGARGRYEKILVPCESSFLRCDESSGPQASSARGSMYVQIHTARESSEDSHWTIRCLNCPHSAHYISSHSSPRASFKTYVMLYPRASDKSNSAPSFSQWLSKETCQYARSAHVQLAAPVCGGH